MAFVLFLLVANTAIALWGIVKSCVFRDGIEFNHVLMFSVGFLLYWILPIGIGAFHADAADPVMALWHQSFDSIPIPMLEGYLVITLGGYLCFWGASAWMTARLPAPTRTGIQYRRLRFPARAMNFFLLAGGLLAALLAFQLRGELFTGYASFTSGFDTQDASERSLFTAVSVFLLSLAFLYTAKKDETHGWRLAFRPLFLNHFFVFYFAVAVLVLSLGGRLYFISSVIMLLAYRSIYFQRIRFRTMALMLTATILLAALVGLARVHGSASVGGAATILLLEPLLTSYSLIYFLQHYSFEIVKFPVFLLSDFGNLLPSFLFPGKEALLLNPQDYGYVIYTPAGAVNSFFSFMINFGVLGTFGSLFFLGGALSYIKGRDRTLLDRVMYAMLTGWIGFTFFRDPFSVSVVKSMFQFSIVTPILTVVVLQIFAFWWRKGRPAPEEGAEGSALASSRL